MAGRAADTIAASPDFDVVGVPDATGQLDVAVADTAVPTSRDVGIPLMRDMADMGLPASQTVRDVAPPDVMPASVADAPLDVAVDAIDSSPDMPVDTQVADAQRLVTGYPCISGNQCVSGFCADGVCCDIACGGTCRACNVAAALGSCTMIPDGQDPADECALSLPNTCGSVGNCNGSGSCALHPSGTACRALQCNPATAVVTAVASCSGTGSCPASATTPCAPWGCSGTACATSCSPAMPCAPGYSCFELTCVTNIGPLLLPSFQAYSTPANLTQLGTVDWAQYGYVATNPYLTKHASPLNGGSHIAMEYVGGATDAGRYFDRPPRFSWTNGTPAAAATDVPDGISVPDANRGFRLTLDGSPAVLRTVRLWLGVWQGRGKLTARLTDNSLPMYTENTLEATNPGLDRVYTIGFRPRDPMQNLVVEWTLEGPIVGGANVTLQAITVSQ